VHAVTLLPFRGGVAEQVFRQQPGQFRLADARRPEEQEAPARIFACTSASSFNSGSCSSKTAKSRRE